MSEQRIPSKLYMDMYMIGHDRDGQGYFWLAFADLDLEGHKKLDNLIDQGLVEQLDVPPRINDDWRRRFPEYSYRFTERGREILATPSKYVEPLNITFRED